MRILMLLSNPYRPDYRVEKEARALKEKDQEVSIIAWDREGDRAAFETIDGIRIHRLGPRAGYNRTLDMITKLPIFWLRGLLRSRKLDFEIIHAHDLDTLVLAWPLSRLRSAKLVYDAHELYWGMIENSVPRFVRNLVERVEKWLVSKPDVVLTPTPYVARYLGDYGAKHLELIMNCEELREPDRERAMEIRRKMGERKVVLYAGTLEPSKNLGTIIDVFKKIRDAEIKLVIGGTGSLVAQVSRASEEMDNVEFIGWIPSNEMLEHVSASDLIIAVNDPRYTNIRLAVSTRLFTAMVAGKPSMVSEGTGDAEIVRTEGTGVIVRFDDVDGIKDTILELLKDEQRLDRIAEKGRIAARERYNWSIMKERLIGAYGSLQAG
ncbi:MAG: glycosyltransferase family 4 protein [Thermoplasmata archaeon]